MLPPNLVQQHRYVHAHMPCPCQGHRTSGALCTAMTCVQCPTQGAALGPSLPCTPTNLPSLGKGWGRKAGHQQPVSQEESSSSFLPARRQKSAACPSLRGPSAGVAKAVGRCSPVHGDLWTY